MGGEELISGMRGILGGVGGEELILGILGHFRDVWEGRNSFQAFWGILGVCGRGDSFQA